MDEWEMKRVIGIIIVPKADRVVYTTVEEITIPVVATVNTTETWK